MELPIKASYTRADYEELPEGAPYELITGQLVMSPSPSTTHQIISIRLIKVLLNYVENNNLGFIFHAPSDVQLSESDIIQPDLYFLKTDRKHLIGKQYIEGAPDLLIEILSPTTAYYDLKQKKNLYEAHQVPEYWIVDPEDKTVEVFLLDDGAYGKANRYTVADTLPAVEIEGLELHVKDIFPDQVFED